MVSEPELKHLGLIGLKTLLLVLLWNYMSTDIGDCAVEARTLAQKNHNKDDPIPCQLNVRLEHVSTQVSDYFLAHLRICLQISRMIASSLI